MRTGLRRSRTGPSRCARRGGRPTWTSRLPGPAGWRRCAPRADQQIAELATHDWDLARATGQPAELDPALAEHALRWSRGMLRPEFRGPGKAFGVEVPVPDDAPAYDRLAGWFGRDPSWTPPGG